MTKFFPKVFITGVVLFLLLGAGYGITQAARAIPWDCSDWQAFAHEDRTTAILESLAENRGKTLYCGVDQSDTFTKAETWAAGKDRNERDDTIYSGERGIFRGFIAAQEGWLTEGESGVTGVSIDRIFEFPREKRRRVTRTKRIRVGSGPAATDACPDPDSREDGSPQPGNLICSGWGTGSGLHGQPPSVPRQVAERNWANGQDSGSRPHSNTWTLNWQTFPNAAYWQTRAETAAASACQARNAKYVDGSAAFGPGDDDFSGSTFNRGAGLGWFYRDIEGTVNYNYEARQSRTWSGVCTKKVRRTRR